jgi:hypothetical protein
MSKDFTRNDGSICTLQRAGNHALMYEVDKAGEIRYEVLLVSSQPRALIPVYPASKLFRNADSAYEYFQLLEYDCSLRRRVS